MCLVKVAAEKEGAAFPRVTFDPDFAALCFDNPLGNVQTETGAAILAGGRGIDLGETLENGLLFVMRNADAGVADCELESDRFLRVALRQGTDLNDNFPLFGEFDRVADQVYQYLPQP